MIVDVRKYNKSMMKNINGKVATVMIVALAAADSFAQGDYFDESQMLYFQCFVIDIMSVLL